MIRPHGSDELNPLFVDAAEARAELLAESASLTAVRISSAAAANAVMLAAG